MTKNHKEIPITGPDRVPRPEQRKNTIARSSRQAAARTQGGASTKDTTPIPETTVPENTTYSGLRGNMITFLAERQDQVAGRLDAKIELLDQRLTRLEEREQPE